MKRVCEGRNWLNVEDNIPVSSEGERDTTCKSLLENSRISFRVYA
jgi:hypothetical protein